MTEHVCKNCQNHFTGKFCNACGEKVYTEKDRSVLKLLGEGFHFLTHFEGTFFNTLKVIFTMPGKFSLDYCNGIRKKYFKPISFFLLLVILYLLFPYYRMLNVNIYTHTHHDLYGSYAMQKSMEVMRSKHLTDPQFTEAFHHAGEKTSKFLLFILIPGMALFSWLMGFKNRKFYFDHFIFTLEAISFFILFGALLLPLFDAALRQIFSVYIFSENVIGAVITTVITTYLLLGSRRFFGFRWWYSVLYAILFSIVLVMFINNLYNFLLFFISLYLV